jgi:hypothetical protein
MLDLAFEFMKVRVGSMFLVIAFCFFPVATSGQQQIAPERKPIDWFYEDANYHSKTLLLKVLQFTAPYSGYYQETSLDTNGNAFTGRMVPNWAVQNSANAKLDGALLAQIRQMLAQLSVPSTPAFLEPQQGQLHSAFIFYDGHDFLRLNYNGSIPAQIGVILAIIHKEFMAAAQARDEEFAAHHKLMQETYGDWQNRSGITINAGDQMHSCKGNGALLVLTAGLRKTDGTTSPVAVSVYHALVFYPGAAVTGAGSGGRWSDDPVQSNVVIWTLPNANDSFAEKKSERKLEILHNAIEATITIAGKTYQLNGGNMFMIRIGTDWAPTVTQLNERFEEQTTPQATLDRFKAIFRDDASIQKLELH